MRCIGRSLQEAWWFDMAQNLIKGAEYPLRKVFSAEFEYHIPQYQRPYAWTTEEAGTLLSDMIDFYEIEKRK